MTGPPSDLRERNLHMSENVIQTTNLTKYYGKTCGIDQINLTVPRGDFFGFIGPNGAGKSTTIRTLLGLIRPTGGQARIFGLDIADNRKQILSRTGYLPSETAFYPGMRVRDVLRLSAELRGRSCSEAARLRRGQDCPATATLRREYDCSAAARLLCERLWLDPARKVDELSLGNKKKTAIVCALQHDPDLLILDEPTSGLDPLMQREFFEILRERAAKGATIFLSSHILSEIQHNCAHAAIIRGGRIIASGSVTELSRTSARRVSIRGRMDYNALSGVKNLRASPDGADFLYNGDMQTLLAVMAGGDIQDVSITEPDLEEVFLHYYGGHPETSPPERSATEIK